MQAILFSLGLLQVRKSVWELHGLLRSDIKWRKAHSKLFCDPRLCDTFTRGMLGWESL